MTNSNHSSSQRDIYLSFYSFRCLLKHMHADDDDDDYFIIFMPNMKMMLCQCQSLYERLIFTRNFNFVLLLVQTSLIEAMINFSPLTFDLNFFHGFVVPAITIMPRDLSALQLTLQTCIIIVFFSTYRVKYEILKYLSKIFLN